MVGQDIAAQDLWQKAEAEVAELRVQLQEAEAQRDVLQGQLTRARVRACHPACV